MASLRWVMAAPGEFMDIVLASQSPRRRMLLQAIGWQVEVRPAEVQEVREPGETPEGMVLRLAQWKRDAAACLPQELVLAADTIVVRGEEVLGKPRDEEDARRMLGTLSGGWHRVITAFAVHRGRHARDGLVQTKVRFRDLSKEEIDAYVGAGESMDKAGSYGIQGAGGALVDLVEGSYPNVVGLPVAEVVRVVREVAELDD